ncbi:MAG: hypothetical protein GWM90_03955, partial [Gemmatimonadetes bacterium]|nr:hypothetical protein [Gemmatimonadota bacterium]NIQ52818.1 hypothetical protein [Gemmatimonadota bacterium]NIU72948.1 hypothetical protein [Gammaproteobacteria bacterium]NIX43303.1 hypothetical protein [Gemmatimonadota bacterium]NIY07473.1 hypothetical protein [Gemmatimonadota bacterium]
RGIVIYSLGLTPPAGVLTLDADGRARLRLPLDDGLRDYHRRTGALLRSILERNGCRIIEAEFRKGDGDVREDPYFSTAHQTGSCRMADHPSQGVVDRAGQVFGYPGLYVADGAAIPSSLAVNTSLTILANAERIATAILDAYPPGDTPAVARGAA